jgi:hypothetical protein
MIVSNQENTQNTTPKKIDRCGLDPQVPHIENRSISLCNPNKHQIAEYAVLDALVTGRVNNLVEDKHPERAQSTISGNCPLPTSNSCNSPQYIFNQLKQKWRVNKAQIKAMAK